MITITLYQNHYTIYRPETIPDRNSRNLKKKKKKKKKKKDEEKTKAKPRSL
jgi:hypothetical protein